MSIIENTGIFWEFFQDEQVKIQIIIKFHDTYLVIILYTAGNPTNCMQISGVVSGRGNSNDSLVL